MDLLCPTVRPKTISLVAIVKTKSATILSFAFFSVTLELNGA